MLTKEVQGEFILCAQSANTDRGIERDGNVIARIDNPITIYFEEDLGEGKAKYWTDDIKKAFVFTKLDDAVKMFVKTNRSYSPVTIRSLYSEDQSD